MRMQRLPALIFGVFAYLCFVASFVYAIGFTGNLVVPRSLDLGPPTSIWFAILVDIGLLALFALQHSGMARRGFKAWWTRVVPEPIERSVYVLAASLTVSFLFWQWRPINVVIWDVENPTLRAALYASFAAGWLLVLFGCFICNHMHLFGLGQVLAYYRRRPYVAPEFRMTLAYRYVRHPLMLGFLVAFWSTPTMTIGRLVLAGVTTLYILIAIRFEERDLLNTVGEAYARYRRQTAMLIPRPWRRVRDEVEHVVRAAALDATSPAKLDSPA